MPVTNPSTRALLGRTFIPDPDEDGVQTRAKVEGVQLTDKSTADRTEALYKFRCRVGERVFEETMTYNKMLEWCDRDIHKDDHYNFESILDHRRVGKDKYDVLVEWSSGEKTWEPLNHMYQQDSVSVSMYAASRGLLETKGW